MPNVSLTDMTVKRLALPEAGTLTYWDQNLSGFGVRVSPKGTKTFIALVGSGARHAIGRYPLIGLSAARDEARRLLAKKTLGTYEKPHTITFTVAVERYLSACADKNRTRTVDGYRKDLDRFSFPSRRLTSVKKRDIAAVLDTISAKSSRAHVLTSIKVFFNWCVGQGYLDLNPLQGLKNASQRVPTTRRALSTEELREVLSKALVRPYPFGPIVAFLILHGQRRNEIARYQWEHITKRTITIPADITKNGREHTFPYGPMTRGILDMMPKKHEAYLFPARSETLKGKPTTVFNGWSKAKRAFDKTLVGVAPYKLHDLRRTFATMLQRIGIPLEVRERLLNHVSGTQAGIVGVYNVHEYEDEMADAIAKYEAFILELLAVG